jgi:hypothetical protein
VKASKVQDQPYPSNLIDPTDLQFPHSTAPA